MKIKVKLRMKIAWNIKPFLNILVNQSSKFV